MTEASQAGRAGGVEEAEKAGKAGTAGKAGKAGKAEANVMAGRICAAAGLSAQSECELLELIGEFDAVEAVRWWTDVKSLAHWLSWSCSMTPGTAREHVRVARAMRRMPTIAAAFREGRLSYSKVREVTRVVDLVDEAKLCRLALTATASQLARTISGYRAATGTRITQERGRTFRWHETEDGSVDLRLRLPKEEAALVLAALHAAKDRYGAPPPAEPSAIAAESTASTPTSTAATHESTATTAISTSASSTAIGTSASSTSSTDVTATAATDNTPAYGFADAMLDVARSFLDTAPEDRSGEDRTLVVVQVSADQLLGSPADLSRRDVPAGTFPPPERSVDPTETGAPAPGTDDRSPAPDHRSPDDQGVELSAVCHIEGVGGIEPETARRLACDAPLIGAVVDGSGEVLALGRTRRLVSRAQRRALMIRDRMCRYPGCAATRHLHAHHVVPWSLGGPTDLDNLLLLCRFHHTAVHEGGMTIRPGSDSSGSRWKFLMPDGRPPAPWYDAVAVERRLTDHGRRRRADRSAVLASVDGFDHPDARRILPGWRGERYDRHACVQALFTMRITPDEAAHADWAA